MKIQLKQVLMILSLLTVFFIPTISYSSCDRTVREERPQMEWYLDECGHWKQGYIGYEEYNDTAPPLVS